MVSGRKAVDISQSDTGRAGDKKETEPEKKKKKGLVGARRGGEPSDLSPHLCPCIHSPRTLFLLSLQLFFFAQAFLFFLFRVGRNEVQERLREAVREVRGRAEECDG